jgi:phosphoribosyl 1,2-cyclic phosphate phosphodiesterase
MKITFLGTAAATSYPLAFCRCTFCNTARERGGKDFRKRSSAIVNDDLLIDIGPDIVSASFLYRKSIADIRYLLQTHSHSDHFDPQVFSTRIPEYMGFNTPKLQVYASTKTLVKMAEMVKNEGYVNNFLDTTEQARMSLDIFRVKPFDSFKIGNYDVTAFPTDHDTAIESLLWAVTEDDFTLFYGTDTDILPEEAWKGFHEKDLKFNVVVLDHTYGPDAGRSGHLNANRFVQQIRRMEAENLLADRARILATHISHEGNPPHAELSEYAARFGYEIAYDGLVI